MTIRNRLIAGAGALLVLAAPAVACEPGVYRASDRDLVALSRPAATGAAVRYTFLDGRRGAVGAPDAGITCRDGDVIAKKADGTSAIWPKMPLTETPTHFDSRGDRFVGMLIEPAGDRAKRPLVVMVHGSEKTSPIGGTYPYLMAAQGLSVFAYDKRGTGASEGDYTQNFELLADDAVAASREARRMVNGRFSRFGFYGGSQGGWVAPLAAKRSQADFVAVGFGLILTPLEEDQEQVFSELRSKGYDAQAIERARIVTDATGAIIASHFTDGFKELAEVKQRFAGEPWLDEINGEFTGDILRTDEADLRRIGRAWLDGLGIIWRYDATAVIGSLAIPQLWVLAASDREAPFEVTRDRLLAIRRSGKPVDIHVFPDTDHGMMEFVTLPDGTRRNTRITEGYFRLVGDWIKQSLAPPYGRGQAAQIAVVSSDR